MSLSGNPEATCQTFQLREGSTVKGGLVPNKLSVRVEAATLCVYVAPASCLDILAAVDPYSKFLKGILERPKKGFFHHLIFKI